MKPLILWLCLAFSLSCVASRRLPPGILVGEAITPQDVVPFATVDGAPASYFERTLLVEATVVAVCQKAGCWMQIEDQGKKAMVRWETGCGGKYTFPTTAVGQRVLIQGSFYPRTISPTDAEHLASEAGRALEIQSEGYEFNASSVLLIDS